MRTTFLFLLATSAAPGLWADACPVATFTTYESFGSAGCTIGTDYTFQNFSYVLSVSLLANFITADDVLVTPINSATDPGFIFTADWDAGGILPSAYVGLLRFTGISTGTPFTAFDQTTLHIEGGASGLVSAATVTEVNCVGGLLNFDPLPACLGGGVNVTSAAQLLGGLGNASATAILSFSPDSLVDVFKEINLVGAIGGSANLSLVSQQFSTAGGGAAVPEPATWTMVSAAVVGMLLLYRQRRTGLASVRRLLDAPVRFIPDPCVLEAEYSARALKQQDMPGFPDMLVRRTTQARALNGHRYKIVVEHCEQSGELKAVVLRDGEETKHFEAAAGEREDELRAVAHHWSYWDAGVDHICNRDCSDWMTVHDQYQPVASLASHA
ncbi:MAG: hypothetical protein ACRD8O_18355 [Bryobacteraceae bacterium]